MNNHAAPGGFQDDNVPRVVLYLPALLSFDAAKSRSGEHERAAHAYLDTRGLLEGS